jgi:hypothetical protein
MFADLGARLALASFMSAHLQSFPPLQNEQRAKDNSLPLIEAASSQLKKVSKITYNHSKIAMLGRHQILNIVIS